MHKNIRPNLDWLLDVDLTPQLPAPKEIPSTNALKSMIRGDKTIWAGSKPHQIKPEDLPLPEGVYLKPIPQHEQYRAGHDGSIWSCKGGFWRKLKQSIDKDGYYQVAWVENPTCNHENFKCQSKMSVHRLILLAFKGTPASPDLMSLHKNGIKIDNRSANLRWGTAKENSEDSIKHGTQVRGEKVGNAKLKEKDIKRIFELHQRGEHYTLIADMYRIHPLYVYSILGRRAWKHVEIDINKDLC